MDVTDVLACKVAVLGGGWSDEREISLDSAHVCMQALREAGFAQVELLDPAAANFMTALAAGGFDVAFIAMHGRLGEDGCIQGLLELLHLPYTFSGVLASALATEKDVAKELFRAAGISTPPGAVFAAGEVPTAAQADELVERLGLPLFVKPVANGSSYGVNKVRAADELAAAIRAAGTGGQRVLVEACIEGLEVTAPVLGNNAPEPLPVIEVNCGEGAEFYDRTVKYEPSELHHIIPARLPAETLERVQSLAVAAHQALGCAGCSRADFIVTADGEPYLLEVNTIPGMTATSLLPDSARHAGIAFPELCRRFVELALENRR